MIRPAPGKLDALILDHAGNTIRHGFVEDPIEWSLDPDTKADNKKHKARGSQETSRLIDCSQCGALRVAGKPCSNCGFMPSTPKDIIVPREGDLCEFDRRARKQKLHEYTAAQKHEWHRMLTAIAIERGYQSGWISWKFKEKFGHWPSSCSVAPLEPSAEVRSWVRSRNIAWAKSRDRRVA